jgi:hypothetical protein
MGQEPDLGAPRQEGYAETQQMTGAQKVAQKVKDVMS